MRNEMQLTDKQTGFTLIELMVVLVILGVLAALIVPKVMDRPDEARVMAAKQDIAAIGQALKLYRLDNMRYPSTEQGLQALVAKPSLQPIPTNWKAGGYLEKLPMTPGARPTSICSPAATAKWISTAWAPTVSRAARAMMPISAIGICEAVTEWRVTK
jgi:general secretion pathway protein G